MLPPGWIEIRAVAEWRGERVMAIDALPAEAWADEAIRDQVKSHLRASIAHAITERLDITFTETERSF